MRISGLPVVVSPPRADRANGGQDYRAQIRQAGLGKLPARREGRDQPHGRLPVDAIVQDVVLQRRPRLISGELLPAGSYSTHGPGELVHAAGRPSPSTGLVRGIDTYRTLQTIDPTHGPPLGDYVDVFV